MAKYSGIYLEKPVDRVPPLKPLRSGSKIAISCLKEYEWLIRAWGPSYNYNHGKEPNRLMEWILHYVGRFDLDDLEWWGMTYPGQPSYINPGGNWTSGLTIQKYVLDPSWDNEVRAGEMVGMYGEVEDLVIPERGVAQVFHKEGELT